MKPKLLVFASGTENGGGSGFEKLGASMGKVLNADIVGVVSNHEHGGVREKADKLRIPFIHFPGPWTREKYREIAEKTGADFFALSGWLKLVTGLPPRTTFNIHPGPLPEFGGAGMYGHHVHEAVMKAFHEGKVTHSAVTMHFVTEEYDRGPVFYRFRVAIRENDTPDSLAKRVNMWEHICQPSITDEVVNGYISWDGKNPDSLKGYKEESD